MGNCFKFFFPFQNVRTLTSLSRRTKWPIISACCCCLQLNQTASAQVDGVEVRLILCKYVTFKKPFCEIETWFPALYVLIHGKTLQTSSAFLLVGFRGTCTRVPMQIFQCLRDYRFSRSNSIVQSELLILNKMIIDLRIS